MERNKSGRHTLFLNYKAENLSKTIFYCPKHLPSIAFYYSKKKKKFNLLQNFLGKESTIESLYLTSSVGSQG